MNRYKPVGWRNHSTEHDLARQGISTKNKMKEYKVVGAKAKVPDEGCMCGGTAHFKKYDKYGNAILKCDRCGDTFDAVPSGDYIVGAKAKLRPYAILTTNSNRIEVKAYNVMDAYRKARDALREMHSKKGGERSVMLSDTEDLTGAYETFGRDGISVNGFISTSESVKAREKYNLGKSDKSALQSLYGNVTAKARKTHSIRRAVRHSVEGWRALGRGTKKVFRKLT